MLNYMTKLGSFKSARRHAGYIEVQATILIFVQWRQWPDSGGKSHCVRKTHRKVMILRLSSFKVIQFKSRKVTKL